MEAAHGTDPGLGISAKKAASFFSDGDFSVVIPHGDEIVDKTLPARKIAVLLAEQKARECFQTIPTT
jgi:hypothetical protein